MIYFAIGISLEYLKLLIPSVYLKSVEICEKSEKVKKGEFKMSWFERACVGVGPLNINF